MKKLIFLAIGLLLLSWNSNLKAQWVEATIPSDNTLYSVDIHESGLCYAAGIDMIKSVDFGVTWEQIVFTGPFALYFESVVVNSIEVVNDSVIVAVGWQVYNDEPVIIRSQDNGVTWNVEWDGTDGSGYELRDVEFYNESLGIVVGDEHILKTTDGGLNWVVTTFPPDAMYDVTFISATVVVVVGNDRILRSTNGGATYLTQTHAGKFFKSAEYDPVANKIQAVYFQISDYNSYAFTSYNAGSTWTSQLLVDDLIHCNEVCANDTVYYGYESYFNVSYNNGVNDFSFTGYPFTHVYDVTFTGQHGLAVAGIWDGAAVYRYDYAAAPAMNQNVDFTTDAEVCFGVPEQHIPTNLTLDSYEWIVEGTIVSSNMMLEYSYPSPGDYEVSLVTSYNGNMDTVTNEVTVVGAPVVSAFNILVDTTHCAGNVFSFSVTNLAGEAGYMVLKDGVAINYTSTSGNTRIYNLGAAFSSATFEVIKWNINTCDSSALTETFTLVVENYPTTSQDFYAEETWVCYGDSTQIVVPVPDEGYIYTLLKNNVTVSIVTAPVGDTLFMTTPPVTGPSQFKLKVKSPIASCLATLTTIDSVFVDPVVADFDLVSEYVYVNDLLGIDASGSVGDSFEWFADGNPAIFTGNTTLAPAIQYDTNGVYLLMLTAESAFAGCKDTLTKTIAAFLDSPDSTTKQICWAKEMQFPQFVLDKHIDKAGNLIVVGYNKFVPSLSYHTKYSAVIQKYDSEGNLLWEWHDVYSDNSDENHSSQISAIETDYQGNIYLVGLANGEKFKYAETVLFEVPLTETDYRYTFLMKLSPEGEFMWWVYRETLSGDFGGFSDVILDKTTNTLYTACPNSANNFEFESGLMNFSGFSRLLIVEIDLNGNYLRHFDADIETTTYIQPISPSGTSKNALISPEIFFGKDHVLYVMGEYYDDQEQNFGDFVLPPASISLRRGFIAKLKVDGPLAEQGWINAVNTVQFRDIGSWEEPVISYTTDSLDNIYQSMNWENLGPPTVIHYDTLKPITGLLGSTVFKYDSDLNYVWHKNFEPCFIQDIYCGNSNDIYFVGRSQNSWYAHFEDSTPVYLIPYNENNLILGSMTVDGEVQWFDQLGQGNKHYADPLTGNACGDVYFSGRCKQNLFDLLSVMPFDFELNDSVYGTFTGAYLFKLADSVCTVGGCATGCTDSAEFLPLVVMYSDTSLYVSDSYDHYQWYYNGVTISGATGAECPYSVNGDYTVFVSNDNGCGAEAGPGTLCLNEDLTIEPVIYHPGMVLTTSTYSSYQWYLDGNLISGATGQTYAYAENGIYTVSVTDGNGCVIVSQPFLIQDIGIEKEDLLQLISVYPNPTNSTAYIRFNFSPTSPKVSLLDMSGKECYGIGFEVVEGGFVMDMSNLESGAYLLRIQEKDIEIHLKIIKNE